MSNFEIKIDIVYNLLSSLCVYSNGFILRFYFFSLNALCSNVNQQNAAYLFLTARKQSLGSFNSCSENVKYLLKGLWGSTFLSNKNLSMDSTTAFS